nr:family 78 glycoside hydrolase catalytic domain [uncultured Cohaesibacter sp.]
MSSTQSAIASDEALTWQANMIAPACDQGTGNRASFVTTDFGVEQTGSGFLSISALGLYRVFINGKRVGQDLLTPGWTSYDKRLCYQRYDVADLLVAGENRITIWLADGWYRSELMWAELKRSNCWGGRVAAIAQIKADGAVICVSDANWKSGLLPITASGIYHGEDYDARLEQEASVAQSGVDLLEFDTRLLVPHLAPPVTEMPPLSPEKTWHDEADRQVFDFGQNHAGYIRFSVKGKAGATVHVEHAEILDHNGVFDNRNYRAARAELRYVLKGGEEESYAPFFTYMGYRYARITLEGDVTLTAVQSVPISSVPETCAGFSCDNPQVNQLVSNTIWSQKANFIEVPTDCPQRDERMGWTGDAQVFAGTACWLADSESFLQDYLRDMMADQREDGAIAHFSPDPTRLHSNNINDNWAGSTGWGDAITIIPWQLYLHYGREDILAECFPAMLRWIDYVWSLADGPIVKTTRKWWAKGFTFGDWLQPVGNTMKPRSTIADDCAATIYHYISTELTARIARILEKTELAQSLDERAKLIKTAFQHEYISPSGRLGHNDQTSYALALLHDLIPDNQIEAAKGYFRQLIIDDDYRIGCGFIGTPALLPALCKHGMTDLAERVFLNPEVPGWLYQVRMGATSIWERWDAIAPDGTVHDPEMNSYNHYSYGAVCQWLFEEVAGIRPIADGAGFDRIRIQPTILPALGSVAMWHDCRHGRIKAGWTISEGKVTYRFSLPKGCCGIIKAQRAWRNIQIDKQPISIPDTGIVVVAGEHVIHFELMV